MVRTMRNMALGWGTVLAFFISVQQPLLAQPSAGAVPTPEAFLGYAIGERFTPPDRIVAYFEAVAAASDRVQLSRYGTTYQGRPLVLATVSLADNLSQIEEIQQQHRDAALHGKPADRDMLVVYLSYGVHGNEASSPEAAMLMLHYLATDEETVPAVLQSSVILLDPMINPDGRARYVSWFETVSGASPNVHPNAAEHREPWPGGRTNHYYFDLNRDWSWMSQQETQARIPNFLAWMPHVHVDYHEQGVDAPYYFAPAARPYHARITDWQSEFQEEIGNDLGDRFDEEGWYYFTGEVFDLLYPGYGDTWPTYNGAIGMTYEQAGGPRGGLAIQTSIGDTLTLADRARHHFVTGIETVQTAYRLRSALISNHRDYHARGRSGALEGPSAYVIRPSAHPARAATFVSLLERQGITVSGATSGTTVQARAYGTSATRRLPLQTGDYVISTHQARGALAHILLESTTIVEDSVTYDLTAWSLPYLLDLEAYEVVGNPPSDAPRIAMNYVAPEAAYAWAIRPDGNAAAQCIGTLHLDGLRLRVADRAFAQGPALFPAGTVILARPDQPHRWRGDLLRDYPACQGPFVHALQSGRSTDGPDLGGGSFEVIRTPTIAIPYSDDVSASEFGELAHTLERGLNYPILRIHPSSLIDRLADVTVIVLPGGSYDDVWTEADRRTLSEWVRAGGRIIATSSALRFFEGQSDWGLAARRRMPDEDTTKIVPYEAEDRHDISTDLPGAIFETTVDVTHPLAASLDASSYVLRMSTAAYPPLSSGNTVVRVASGRPVNGFSGYRLEHHIDGSLVVGVRPMGRGEVVYFADPPAFRGIPTVLTETFWYSVLGR